jgi:hypothetical protein
VRVGLAADLQTVSDVDGRYRIAKRLRQIMAALVSALAALTSAPRSRHSCFAALLRAAPWPEDIEARLAAGEEVDVERHAVLCSVICRLATRIGLTRVPREIEPLNRHLEQKYGAADAADEETA